MVVFRTLRPKNGAEIDHVLVLLVYGFARNSKFEVTSLVYERYFASFFVFVTNLSSRNNYVLLLSTTLYLVKALVCDKSVTTQNL